MAIKDERGTNPGKAAIGDSGDSRLGQPEVAVLHHRFKHYGGAERVANAIADTLDADLYTLYVSEKCASKTDATPLQQEKYTDGIGSKLYRRLAVENLSRSLDIEHVDLSGYDIVITSGDYAHFYLPIDEQTHIHYLHTPNRDYFNAPEYHALAGGRLKSVKTLYFQWLRGRDLDHANHVDRWLCNSEFIRDRCQRFYSPEPLDLDVLEPPVAWESLGPASGDRGDHWLTVGRLVGAKRIDVLVDAFRDIESRLLIAGSGPERDRLEPDAPENVEFLGFVDESEKHRLLQSARGFLFAGERECFGMSVAEALSAGCPLIGVDEGNIPYMVEEDDGLLVEPRPTAVREAVRQAEGVTWDHAAIRERAEDYSEGRFADRLEEVITSVKADNRTRMRRIA